MKFNKKVQSPGVPDFGVLSPGSCVLGLESQVWDPGLESWDLGLGSWVLISDPGAGSQVTGAGFWVQGPGSWVLVLDYAKQDSMHKQVCLF